MDVTREQLAVAIAYARNVHGDLKGHYKVSSDQLAAELLDHVAAQCTDGGCSYCSPEAVADAHICCDHAGDAPGPFSDAEVAAMAALVPVLPLVSRLGVDARDRVMDWARRRACDGLPPF